MNKILGCSFFHFVFACILLQVTRITIFIFPFVLIKRSFFIFCGICSCMKKTNCCLVLYLIYFFILIILIIPKTFMFSILSERNVYCTFLNAKIYYFHVFIFESCQFNSIENEHFQTIFLKK